MDLVLGVIDMPYVDEGGVTTGQVAGFLEKKYGVMEHFAEIHQADIQKALADSVADAITSITAGAPLSLDPFGDACDEIKALFSSFIERKELDGRVDGVPTEASLKGVSKRFKRKRGPVRPSFLDSTLYETSMKVWTEDSGAAQRADAAAPSEVAAP